MPYRNERDKVMKKFLVIILCFPVIMLFLTSCENTKNKESSLKTTSSLSGTASFTFNTTKNTVISGEEESMFDKLNQIKEGWTNEQVVNLLGEPDEYGGTNIVMSLIYHINDTEKAYISCFGYKVFNIYIQNAITGETTTIIEDHTFN